MIASAFPKMFWMGARSRSRVVDLVEPDWLANSTQRWQPNGDCRAGTTCTLPS